MKKNNTVGESSKQSKKRIKACEGSITIGMDLGDKTSRCCAIEQSGEVLLERSVATTKKGMAQLFGAMARCRIAIEVGTHSAWVSRLLSGLGDEVIVANARQVKLISQSTRKNDKLDAQMLARLARLDPQLLRPIRHRSERGATGSDADPGASGGGGGANEFGKRRARTGESAGGAVGEMRYRQAGGGTTERPAGSGANSAEAVVGRSGIVDRKDTCLRRRNRADRPDPVSGNRPAAASEPGWAL
jgi:hypothetical protein